MIRTIVTAFFFALGLATGCTSAPTATAPAAVEKVESQPAQAPHWWYVRFRLNWPEDEAPNWSLDTLLADQVCEPVLDTFRERISLWRFHRRAARDGAGRQFSFIYYTDPTTAAAIRTSIKANPIVTELLLRGALDRVGYDESSQRPAIEDTSDRGWSEVIQKAWPYYIMGISATWLDLIDQIADDESIHPQLPVSELRAKYDKISDTLDEIWKLHGKHAFLHHLNALFGYRPLYMNY